MSNISCLLSICRLLNKKLYFSLLLTLFFIVSSAFCSVFLPVLFKKIIDQLSTNPNLNGVEILFIIYASVMILQKFLNEMQFIVYSPWECGVIETAFKKIDEALFLYKSRFFSETLPGSITSKVYQSISGLDLLMFDFVLKILPMCIQFILILSSITLIFNLKMSLTIAMGVLTYVACMHLFNKKLINSQNAIRNNIIDSQGITTDLISAWKDIKLTNSQEFVNKILNNNVKKRVVKTNIFYQKRGIFGFIQSVPICVTILLVNYQAISSYTLGLSTIGGIILINNYLLQILSPLESFSIILRSIIKNYSDFTIYTGLLSNEKDVVSNECVKQETHTIHVSNLKINDVLIDVNLEINKGDKVAIIGHSGSGKTTLLNTLAGLDNTYLGEIFLNRINVKSLPENALMNNVAYLSSDARFIKESIKNNIVLGRDVDITESLKFACMTEKINTLDQGINSLISENSQILSTGEIQRLKIARTLALNRKIEIYDEATSALNSEVEENIINNLLSRDDKTIIFVTHKHNFLDKFDKVYNLKDGCLIQYKKADTYA